MLLVTIVSYTLLFLVVAAWYLCFSVHFYIPEFYKLLTKYTIWWPHMCESMCIYYFQVTLVSVKWVFELLYFMPLPHTCTLSDCY